MSLNNTQSVKAAVQKPIAEVSNGNGKKESIKTAVLVGLGAAAAISIALLAIRKGKSVNLNKIPARRQVLKFLEKK